MTSYLIASLHLIDSGNVDLDYMGCVDFKNIPLPLKRLHAVQMLWDNHDFQAMLDKAIEADKGGVAFE